MTHETSDDRTNPRLNLAPAPTPPLTAAQHEDLIDRLAAEAEAGYDVSRLTARPSMLDENHEQYAIRSGHAADVRAERAAVAAQRELNRLGWPADPRDVDLLDVVRFLNPATATALLERAATLITQALHTEPQASAELERLARRWETEGVEWLAAFKILKEST